MSILAVPALISGRLLKISRQISQLFHHQHGTGAAPFGRHSLANQFVTYFQYARLISGRDLWLLPFSKFVFQTDPESLQFPVSIAPFEIFIWQIVVEGPL